ncbi:MAG TPA: hypothetical protein VF921_20625 [Vicinamibacterales bacterium]
MSDIAPDPATAAAQIDPATFQRHVGTTFLVDRAADRIPLRLDEVVDARSGGGMLRFSLFFHGPPDRLLAQGTYPFHHDALGAIALFIVPIVGSNAERIVYEACFSRPTPPAPAP